MTNQTRTTIDTAATVNEILAKHPAAVSVFIEFGIDSCCGGDVSLREAAQRDGANLGQLVTALDTFVASGASTP